MIVLVNNVPETVGVADDVIRAYKPREISLQGRMTPERLKNVNVHTHDRYKDNSASINVVDFVQPFIVVDTVSFMQYFERLSINKKKEVVKRLIQPRVEDMGEEAERFIRIINSCRSRYNAD